MKKRNVLILFLVLLNITLIVRLIILRRDTTVQNVVSRLMLSFVPHFSLISLDGEMWTSEKIVNQAPYTMLVFFSLQDCQSCLLESSLWESIYEGRDTAVIGVARHVNERELKIWAENAKLKFPILFDHGGRVTALFQIVNTPLKILMDNSGRILLSDPVRIGQSEYDEFQKLLADVIQ